LLELGDSGVALLVFATDSCVAGEQDALVLDRCGVVFECLKGLDRLCEVVGPNRFQVTNRILHQIPVFRNPHQACPALLPVVPENRGCFAALADSGSIANQEASTEATRQNDVVLLASESHGFKLYG